MNDLGMQNRKNRRCSYDNLTPDEIKKLKNNGYDPHEEKERGSKDDFVKCKPSGNVAIRRKTKYQDSKTGEWVYPKEDFMEFPEINIYELPWLIRREAELMKEEIIIQFRVSGFRKKTSEVVKLLELRPTKSWSKGEYRTSMGKLQHKENGMLFVNKDADLEINERALKILRRLYKQKDKLIKLKAFRQLQCVAYLEKSQRPIICFSEKVLNMLSDLKSSLDIDIYYLSED